MHLKPRPVYEKKSDLSNELMVANALGKVCNFYAQKAAEFFWCDFIMRRDARIISYMEVKCRTNKRDQYPTYMISKAKYDKLIDMDKPAILAVRWIDFTGFIKLNTAQIKIEKGGRRDRNDNKDVEECVFINIADFNCIANNELRVRAQETEEWLAEYTKNEMSY